MRQIRVCYANIHDQYAFKSLIAHTRTVVDNLRIFRFRTLA